MGFIKQLISSTAHIVDKAGQFLWMNIRRMSQLRFPAARSIECNSECLRCRYALKIQLLRVWTIYIYIYYMCVYTFFEYKDIHIYISIHRYIYIYTYLHISYVLLFLLYTYIIYIHIHKIYIYTYIYTRYLYIYYTYAWMLCYENRRETVFNHLVHLFVNLKCLLDMFRVQSFLGGMCCLSMFLQGLNLRAEHWKPTVGVSGVIGV